MATPYTGIEKYIFADVYNLFLKYKDIPDENYYWEQCINDAKILVFKYMDHPLASALVHSTISQLEHKISGNTINGLSHEEWEDKLKIAHKMGFQNK